MYYTDSIEVFICLIWFDDSKNCYTRQLTNYSIYICSYIYKLSPWGNVLFWQAPAGAVNINYSFFYIFWKYIIQNKAVNSANPFVVACLHVVRIIIFQQIIVINEQKIYYYFVHFRRKILYWLSIWYYIRNMNINKSNYQFTTICLQISMILSWNNLTSERICINLNSVLVGT